MKVILKNRTFQNSRIVSTFSQKRETRKRALILKSREKDKKALENKIKNCYNKLRKDKIII